jgi:hypothetical protein
VQPSDEVVCLDPQATTTVYRRRNGASTAKIRFRHRPGASARSPHGSEKRTGYPKTGPAATGHDTVPRGRPHLCGNRRGDCQQNPQLGHELQHGLTNRGRRCRELRPGSTAKVANRDASAYRQSAPRPNESLRPQPSVLPESAKPTTPPAVARRSGERRLFSAWSWTSASAERRHSNATRGTTAKPNNDHARRRPLATAHREFSSGLDACCATVQTKHEYGPDHRKQKP